MSLASIRDRLASSTQPPWKVEEKSDCLREIVGPSGETLFVEPYGYSDESGVWATGDAKDADYALVTHLHDDLAAMARVIEAAYRLMDCDTNPNEHYAEFVEARAALEKLP